MEESTKKYQQLIAKCWTDEAFKQKLQTDPAGTLEAEGIELPAGRTVRVVADTDQLVHLVIPKAPGELSDDELSAVAGGVAGGVDGAIAQFFAAYGADYQALSAAAAGFHESFASLLSSGASAYASAEGKNSENN